MTPPTGASPARVRVLMLVDCLGAKSGGAERFMVGLATHLPPARYEVWVCTTRVGNGPLIDSLRNAGVKHVSLGRRSKTDLPRLRGLARLLRTERFDILHAHMFGSNIWATLFGRLFRVPVVIAHEQTWSYEGSTARRLLDGHFIGRFATRFVAVSTADRDRMISIEGVRPSKTECIPNAYIPRANATNGNLREELGLEPDVPLIGTIALMRPQKALDVLLDAHAAVLRSHPRSCLILAGDGDCREALERKASELDLGDRVRFLGVRQDADRILRSVDIAALSSDFEGTPLFMLECMANRTPLVATDVGGIREVLTDGESAILVPPRDPRSLGRAICALIDDPARREAIGQAGNEQLGPYRIEVITERFAHLYDELLQERGQAPRP